MADGRLNSSSTASSPAAPPFLPLKSNYSRKRSTNQVCSSALFSTRDLWDKIFEEGYRADVLVQTTDGIIRAHSIVLGIASPVMKTMLKQSKGKDGRRNLIPIRGVPHEAVWVFLRFLYSSCYQKEEMNQYVLHLLVLSHVFVIPSLKEICMQQLERDLLTVDNVVDIYQLARLCDAPRLSLLCHRMIVTDFKIVSATEGWKVMRHSNPQMEKELLESVIDADMRKKERLKKLEERKIYLQLHEAMEALVHICRDGCRTIGPHDKVLKRSEACCNYPACKGLESLVRHFARCKNRVQSSCPHCKRMWQLLELHSHLCHQSEGCRVPLCSHFKEKKRSQNKEEVKWKLLVSKVQEARNFSGATFSSSSLVAVSA